MNLLRFCENFSIDSRCGFALPTQSEWLWLVSRVVVTRFELYISVAKNFARRVALVDIYVMNYAQHIKVSPARLDIIVS